MRVVCRFLFDPIKWKFGGVIKTLDIATYSKLVALSGMYPEAYKMDVDTKVIDSSGDRLLTTKTAMYVDPKFVDTSKFGS